MTLNPGNRVVYPCQGPCRVDRVVKKKVGTRRVSFYHLVLLDDSGAEVFVPVDKADEVGLRRLIKKSDVPKLLSQLKRKTPARRKKAKPRNWKQRAVDNLKLLTSGSPSDLVKVVRSLTALSERKKLSAGESQTLQRARSLLIFEIAEALRKTKRAAERQLDSALTARR